MEFVNGKDDIPYISIYEMENRHHVWNHQPEKHVKWTKRYPQFSAMYDHDLAFSYAWRDFGTLESLDFKKPPHGLNKPSGQMMIVHWPQKFEHSQGSTHSLRYRVPNFGFLFLVVVAPNYSCLITINPTCNLLRSSEYLKTTINIGTWWLIPLKWLGLSRVCPLKKTGLNLYPTKTYKNSVGWATK